jgi:hypothetical protein
MRTRSQTKLFVDTIIADTEITDNFEKNDLNTKPYYGEFVFDFDDASKHWNANKKKMENACYIYVCGYLKSKTGKKCMNKTRCGECCRFHK